MLPFPKKYNYKNIKNKPTTANGKKIYSRFLSLDQKIHPGALFSIFFQDYYSKIQSCFSIYTEPVFGFSPSSIFYSNLNKKKIDFRQLHLDAKKQLKQNIKFLDKLGLASSKKINQALDIDFYIFVRKFFSFFYQSGKIFSKKEIVFWDKHKQTNTPINHLQIQKKNRNTFILKYFIEAKGISLLLETDSIETIFADVAVAVNPQDKRYKKLIGQNVIIPIINKNIPIIGDESVDPFSGSGVVRITPGHDEYGLEVAQNHGLPTDIFSIDIDGNFTKHTGEFAGKPLTDFYNNIVKYIDDIGNLDSKVETQKNFFYDSKSGAELFKIALDQWNIKHDYSIDYLIEQIKNDKLIFQSDDIKNNILNYLENLSFTSISNKFSKGLLIPILYSSTGQTYFIDETVLLDSYKKSRSRRDFTLSAIILNLILNNQLNPSFTIDELVSVLFDLNFSNNQTTLFSYINLYETYENSSFRDGHKLLKRFVGKLEDDVEKIKLLGELLDDSFAISQNGHYYQFDFSSIFDTDQDLVLQTEDSFSKDFLDSLLFLFYNNLDHKDLPYSDAIHLGEIFLGTQDEKEFAINLLLLSLDYSKTFLFGNLFFHPNLILEDNRKLNNYNSKFLIKEISNIVDIYGPDATRLMLLLSIEKNGNIVFDTSKVNDFKRALDKIWNAYRYVYTNISANTIHFIDIQNKDLTDYDVWILHGFKSLLGDIQYQFQENNLLVVGKKILNFITNDLCDKYLESVKLFSKENTKDVVSFIFFRSLGLLKTLVPLFSQELLGLFGEDSLLDYDIYQLSEIELNEKNYKTNILMEIVDKINAIKNDIGLQKHDVVDIFIQSTPDFIDFLNYNESLFKKLTNTGDLLFVRIHEPIPSGYQTDNIININIGAKKSEQASEITKDSLSILIEELKYKKEQLDHMKTLIASVSSTVSPEILIKKRYEIQKLQDDVDHLELQISKLKIKN